MDVTANLVSNTQLDTWMQAAVQRTLATVDEWCTAMNSILGGNVAGTGCPRIDAPGTGLGTGMDQVFICGGMNADGSNRSSLPQISSTQFLTCLRNVQLTYNSVNPAPGGSTTTPGTSTLPGNGGGNGGQPTQPVGTQTAPGQGVLGPTNCAVCQQLASNPLMLLILAVAAWYLFFK